MKVAFLFRHVSVHQDDQIDGLLIALRLFPITVFPNQYHPNHQKLNLNCCNDIFNLAGKRRMNFFRKKRPETDSLTENRQRAQKLNNAANRMLEHQIANYEREEKQLQKELVNLRRTRETIDAGIRLILPQSRPRRITEPLSPRTLHAVRRNSGFSAHASEKLPQIVTSSPSISGKLSAKSQEDPLQWCKTTSIEQACFQGNQAKDASSMKDNKTCFLTVPEK